MRRTLLVIIAVVLFVAALAGWAVFLSSQTLENAGRWVSVSGFFVNALLTTGSLVLGWRALRSRAPDPGRADQVDEVTDTGGARATGGGRAGTGLTTAGDDRPARVTRSGDAVAEGPGSVANTGVQRRRPTS